MRFVLFPSSLTYTDRRLVSNDQFHVLYFINSLKPIKMTLPEQVCSVLHVDAQVITEYRKVILGVSLGLGIETSTLGLARRNTLTTWPYAFRSSAYTM